MNDVKLLDIGDYANDSRLVNHSERHATFFGERCTPAICVRSTVRGYVANRSIAETGERRDGFATATEALVEAIGPVIPR